MDNTDENNVAKWILIDSVENAEEVTETYDTEDHMKNALIDSDLESDGISIISHNESSAEEEYIRCSGASNKIDNVSPVSNEDTMKWTLSDSEVVSRGLPPKTFFLDCLQESIEELSEQELGTNQSDPKSDDVAIISERESDFMNDNEASLPEPGKRYIEIQNLDLLAKYFAYIHKYFNGLVIGSILLATISLFLGSYLDYTVEVDNELHHYKKNVENVFKESSDNIDKLSTKYMIATLYLCEQKFKSDSNSSMQQNVHKCLVQIEEKFKKKQDHMTMKDIEKLQKRLEIKEHYLNEKEKFLIKKEYDLLKEEMKLQSVKKQHNFKNKNRNKFKFDTDQRTFEYENNHIHKNVFKGNVNPKNDIHEKRSCKGHWKNKKDELNDSKELLRAVQENFYAYKDNYFKMNHRNEFSTNKEQRKCDSTHRAKKQTDTIITKQRRRNDKRKPNYKHDKAQTMEKY